jgi:hypothetical protein
MAILVGHYPHLLPSHSSSNQLATRVTLPFMGGSELRSGEGLGTSLDKAMARRHQGVCMSMLADHYAIRSSNIESTAFEGSVNTFRSQPRGLSLVRFGLQYVGWRSTSLGLGELTPGYCGNAFGVKNRTAGLNQIITCVA